MPEKPSEKSRAYAEMLRTAAAVSTLLITIGLFADKLGWW